MPIGSNIPVMGTWSDAKRTANAGTVIAILVPPMQNARTCVKRIEYTNLATAHTITIMRPIGKTTLSAAAAGGQADINLTADPGNFSALKRTADNLIAANDYLVIQLPDGTYLVDTVSVVAALVITLANNLPTLGAASGATVWYYGIRTDTDPTDARPHPLFAAAASVTTVLDGDFGIVTSHKYNEPIIIEDANATNAGTYDLVQALYLGNSSPYFGVAANN